MLLLYTFLRSFALSSHLVEFAANKNPRKCITGLLASVSSFRS